MTDHPHNKGVSMADEAVVEETTQVEGATTEQETGTTSPETGTEESTEQKLIFGKYTSLEEAEKGWAEEKKLLDRQGNEVGQLRKELEIVKAQADQAGAIKELVETLKPKEQAPDWNAQVQQWTEQFGEDQAQVLATSLKTTSIWMEKDRQRLQAELEEKYGTALNEVKGQVQAEREARIKLTPEYRDNKELAESFVARGMKLNDAVEMAATINDKIAPKAPGRTLPASVGATHTTEPPKAEAFKFTAEEVAEWKERGLEDEEIAQLEVEYAERKKTGGE